MKQFIHSGIVILLTLMLLSLSNCKKDDEKRQTDMEVLSLDPESPDSLNFGEFVVITTSYNIIETGGARMWVQPFTEGEISPGYIYSSSNVFTGSGIRQVGISVSEEEDSVVVVDQLKIICRTPDQAETLVEEFMDVNYVFTNE